MRKEPVKVKLIGKKGNSFEIQFPNLKIPVKVDENIYNKMLHSSEYDFSPSNSAIKRTYSA